MRMGDGEKFVGEEISYDRLKQHGGLHGVDVDASGSQFGFA